MLLEIKKKYVRPVLVSNEEPVQILITSGRHPVLESFLGERFVPNDTCLHSDGEYCQVVTGPNMGGKSCYIRQVALMAIMSQVGSFVPASSARLHVLDGIYTRMGASDSIQHGSSTFFEELGETSHILKRCTSRSLVIIDELGRGTSTHDGVAIAYATLHHLLCQKKCLILFVTHYPQILDIQREFEGSVGAYHVSYLTSLQKGSEVMEPVSELDAERACSSELTFLYKVVGGASDKSFGLNVARLAQIPHYCISRAAFMAAKLEAQKALEKELRAPYNSLHSPNLKHGGNAELFEELGKAFQSIYTSAKSVMQDTDTVRILYCLKIARELAQIAAAKW